LKFNDVVGVLLSEDACRKSSGFAETLRSTLSVNQRGRRRNKEKKKNERSKSKSGKDTSKLRGA